MDFCSEVTRYLHDHIPLTFHMGVRVSAYDERSVRLSAPLCPNLNHRNTAFGGSLSTLGILAGWTLLHLRLRDAGIANRLVIQKSEMDFKLPATGDLEVVCLHSNLEEWDRFTRMIVEKEKSRLTLVSEIYSEGELVAVNEGVFVSLRM
ncbi:MAG: thioesterase domain-containing protein [bacterium]|nr:thioesterase domain-containing protein [bacterium]